MYDRWVVSTWGRTGSMVIGEKLYNFIADIRHGPIEWKHHERTGGYFIPVPWTLTHSHSLEQLDYVDDINTGVVYAIRNPSDAGLSMFISYSLTAWHIHTEKSLNEKRDRLSDPRFKDKWQTYKRELRENDRWKNAKPIHVNITELDDYRDQCITWNNIAATKLKSINRPIVIANYDEWSRDLVKLSKILNIPYKDVELSVLPNLRPMLKQIENYDEVMNWKRLNSYEDEEFIEDWSKLPTNFSNTCP